MFKTFWVNHGRRPVRALLNAVCGVLLVSSMFSASSSAQQREACTGTGAGEFEFWIGNWDIQQRILQRDGSWLELPARTSVSKALDGCALIEHWQGEVLFFWQGMQKAEPMKGLSIRSRDPKSGNWQIFWMDTRAPLFGNPYIGQFTDGRGEFFREWGAPDGPRKGRITFTDITENTVRWELAVSTDSGRTFNSIWTMTMRRAEGQR